jgi:RNA polymerase sigma-70 factor (ECF subfamily)
MAVVELTPTVSRTAAATAAADFDALFVVGYPRLVRTVGFICGDADVAADCVADAFERAYVRWRRVSRLDDPLGWVRRVAINRATDVHRRSARGRRAVQRLAGRAEAAASVELAMSDALAFRDSALATAVSDLSPQQRAVVALHYLDDLAVAEVADAMGLSEGAVKYHLHQARGRLRTLLGPADTETETGTNEARPT